MELSELVIGLFFTIPYTGTWGVVIGKATGAGAFTEEKRKTIYHFLAELQT